MKAVRRGVFPDRVHRSPAGSGRCHTSAARNPSRYGPAVRVVRRDSVGSEGLPVFRRFRHTPRPSTAGIPAAELEQPQVGVAVRHRLLPSLATLSSLPAGGTASDHSVRRIFSQYTFRPGKVRRGGRGSALPISNATGITTATARSSPTCTRRTSSVKRWHYSSVTRCLGASGTPTSSRASSTMERTISSLVP